MIETNDLDEIAARENSAVIQALSDLNGSVQSLAKRGIVYRPPEESTFILSANPQSTHVKMRINLLVIMTSIADDVNLRLGNITITFRNITGPTVVPLPHVLERGVDVSAVPVGASVVTAFFTYVPE